jgi:hypothetical protein
VALTFSIPDGVTANYFYQIYRSAMSGSSVIEPNDELQLVIEDNPSAGEITAKEISVTESTESEYAAVVRIDYTITDDVFTSSDFVIINI